MEKYKETESKGEKKMRGKYLNPKADLIFKMVFGEHPDLVMSLLNALLPLPDDGQIESVEYLTPEMVPDNPAKKDSVVDVRCKDQQGRQFIVRGRKMQGPAGAAVHRRDAALLERGVQAACAAQCLKGHRASA